MNGNASVERSGATAEDIARARPGDRQPDQPDQDLEPHGPVGRQVVAEPARVVDLRRQRPNRKNSSASVARATVNSPTIRPSLSIAVSVIRPAPASARSAATTATPPHPGR